MPSYQFLSGTEVWRIKAEMGVPLDMQFIGLAKAGYLPTWGELFLAAKKDGANLDKLARELLFFVKEAYEDKELIAYCELKLQQMPAWARSHE